LAMKQADSKHDSSITTEKMSFMEVMHHTKAKKAEGQSMCCPCGSS
jgi:hypothetical protein